ncbi:hypothetical protein [Methylobacterium sp. NEAU K]|uniref:hypothetical protein n=1 Tax=Methylobacterium sp. NEAU K TaxID=3064946 RepID=UPI002736D6BB|nr:hypothetical protein [Methylobacterium sp. NEAU K]MDP4005062.1 hypothetical protein [Methylobacterium sp. NEAU K]
MGASTQTTNSQQNTTQQPWTPAIPGLQQVLGDATSLYDSGTGDGVYSGQRVAQLNGQSLTGLQMAQDQASSDNAGALGTSYLQNILGSGGISPTTAQGLSMLSAVPNVDTSALSGLASSIGSASNPINQTAKSFMSGAQNLDTIPQLDQLYAKSQAPSEAETNLSGMAAGQDLDPTKNAIFQNLVNTSSANALQAQKEAFAASGRYGSGAFAGAANKAVNDTDTALYAGQYNQNVANQLSANSQIDAARQAASQLGLGITNAKSGVESTNNNQLLAGAQLGQGQQAAEAGVLGQVLGGDEFNSNLGVTKAQGFIGAGQTGQAQALSAASALPALDALRYTPSQIESNVGSVLQNQDQNNINAAMDYYNQTQQEPWSYLGQYAGLLGGIGGMGSEGTSIGHSTTQTQQSMGSTLLGGLTSIGGLAANLGKATPFLSMLGL